MIQFDGQSKTFGDECLFSSHRFINKREIQLSSIDLCIASQIQLTFLYFEMTKLFL